MTYYLERDTHCAASDGLRFLGSSNPLCLAFWVARITGVYSCAGLSYMVVKSCVCISQLNPFLFCSCELGGAFSHQSAYIFCFKNAALNVINCSTLSVQKTIWFSPTNEIEHVAMYSTIDLSFCSWKRLNLVTALFYFANLPDAVCQDFVQDFCVYVHEWDWPSIFLSKAELA